MGSTRKPPGRSTVNSSVGIARTTLGTDSGDRIVHDRLPDSFTLDRSESEWLLTLLTAEELRYIFEGSTDDKNRD